MKDQSSYVVLVALNNVTFTSREILAPDVSVAIARAVLSLSPGDEEPIRNGVILNVRVYKCITINEEINYAL